MKNIKSVDLPHKMPKDLEETLKLNSEISAKWKSLTPLSQNEFICWVESAKQIETRKKRIVRVCEELKEGKRRPCCWIGCVHRQDKKLSSTQQWLRRNKKI